MAPRCPTCGAPVDYAPDGDPKYDPARARFAVGDESSYAHMDGTTSRAKRLPNAADGIMRIELSRG